MLALCLGCDVAHGPTDLANDVFEPARYRIETPGTRLLAGRDLRLLAAPRGQWLVVGAGDDPRALRLVNPGAASHCDAGPADAWILLDPPDQTASSGVRLATLADPEPDGAGHVRVLDAACRDLVAPLERALLPASVVTGPARYVLLADGGLVTVDAESGLLVRAADEVTWFDVFRTQPSVPSPLRFVELMERGRFAILDSELRTVVESAQGVALTVPPVADPLGAVLLLDGHTLLRAELRSPYLTELADDVCWVSPLSDPRLPVVRTCAGATGFLPGTASPGALQPLPAEAVRVYQVLNAAQALYTESGDASGRVDLSLLGSDGAVTEVARSVIPFSDLWRPTPLGTAVECVAGSDLTLERHVLEPPATQVLATSVYLWPSRQAELPLIDRFAAPSGRWVELDGFQDPALSVVAEGVVPDGGFAPAPSFAPAAETPLSVQGQFAFLRNFSGRSGDLVLAHAPPSSLTALTVGWSELLASGVPPHAFAWLFGGAALLYVSDAGRNGAGDLHVYRSDLDLDQRLVPGVSALAETSSPDGVAYVVPQGDGAGLWHARLE